MDERNVYGIGPRIERGEARGAKGERCRWVVERKGLPLPLLEQTLPFAAVGRVPGWAVQASRDRMDFVASTLTQTDRTSHLQKFH